MESGPAAAPLLRPMEVGELLDEAFDLYRRNFRLFFGIAMLLYAPLGLLILTGGENSGWTSLGNIVGGIAGLVTTCALGYAAIDRIHGRATTIAGAYRRGLGRMLRLFSASLIAGLAAFAGLLLLVVPGVIVILWMQLLTPVAVVENRGGIGALERARKLAQGELWRLFFIGIGLMMVVGVFNLAMLGLVGLLVGVFGLEDAAPGEPVDSTVQYVAFAVIYLVYTLSQSAWAPLLTLTQSLAYVDLRIRKEAYDLELLTGEVEARVAAARSAIPAPGGTPPPGAMEPAT
jgi:hypothetical protein